MRKSLFLALMLVFVLTICTCFVCAEAAGFDVDAIRNLDPDSPYHATEDDGCIFIDSGYANYFTHRFSIPSAQSYEYSDIIVITDNGPDPYGIMRIWFDLYTQNEMKFDSVSFFVEDTEYRFNDLYSNDRVTKVDNGYRQLINIIIDSENVAFLAHVNSAFGDNEDKGIDMTLPAVLHGTEDISITLDYSAVLDMVLVDSMMNIYGGSYDIYGTPMQTIVNGQETAAVKETKLNVKKGDTLFLGSYEQDNIEGNGKEPIEWIVLKVENNKALLLSKYVLDCLPYHDKYTDTKWVVSSLRDWLKNHFYQNAFTQAERSVILEGTVSNSSKEQPKKNKWEGKGGVDTIDKVFLLSWPEVLANKSLIKVEGTEYANKQGAKGLIGKEATWWTRSVGAKQKEATYVYLNDDPSSSSVSTKQGIRPAMWISLEAPWDAFSYQLYMKADNLAKHGRFADAYAITDTLGTYNDSNYLSSLFRLLHAVSTLDNGDPEKAIELLSVYYDYNISKGIPLDKMYYDTVPECYYTIGCQQMQAGDYKKAIETFSELGQYKDTMTMLRTCFDKTHTQYRWMTGSNDAVNA